MAESDKGLYLNSVSTLDEDQVDDGEDLAEDEALFTIPTLLYGAYNAYKLYQDYKDSSRG